MHVCRINYKKISLCIFVIAQVILFILYYFCQRDEEASFVNRRISFLNAGFLPKSTNQTYHTEGDLIKLVKKNARDEFVNFNSSLCFLNGTDLKSMDRSKYSWSCNCKKGWHGTECGQPEVVWRALLTYRKKLHIKGPRSFARRILYIFEVNEFVENLLEIRVNELHEVVDLFILIEKRGNKIETKLLLNNLLKKFHDKILYLSDNKVSSKDVWLKVSSSIDSLDEDDVILINNSFEIPNKFALSFMKYYDNWPEPISFRLRWSVFGFFWLHPTKTKIEGVAFTIKYMRKVFDSNFENLYNISRKDSHLIFGDLNHCGGWFCEFCMDPPDILKFATSQRTDVEFVNWKELKRANMDTNYVEDLIGNGLHIDGKTELERSRRYHDLYFAPEYVLNNSMLYDYLLINLYTKLDYYEG